MEGIIKENFYEKINKDDEIKLETLNKYYYKGKVKKIENDFILIRDIRGTLWEIKLKDIYFIEVFPKGYKKLKIFNKEDYKRRLNSNVILKHIDEKPINKNG